MHSKENKHGLYEFFAGGGMARAGLGRNYDCLFANDISPKKANSYRLNYAPASEFRQIDITRLSSDDLPPGGKLAWSSFPCQDISLAGPGRGLAGERSGTFWKFWELIQGLNRKNLVPVLAIENVIGLLSGNGGRDYKV